ncbi:MAG: FKBP-type peptidyl-prolyl cis-trans isomerase [Roseibium sp.]|nr:FKBP-type peptidyl-prolyl cis-trans isomerase [Roseibium sp.]
MRILRAFSGLLVLIFAIPALAAELQIKDIAKGSGDTADVGETVVVHYTGWLMDGTKFDSSLDRGTPFSFTLGERRVIPGWEQGVEGMQVGGKRELIIPPELGYGAQGAGGVIPPNATLRFEIELLEVKGKKYSDIDNDEIKAALAAGTPVIDIRRPDEWKATGVIPGVRLLTFFDASGNVNPNFGAELQKVISGPADKVVFICQAGNRSKVLSEYLSGQAGFTNVANVTQGMNGWLGAGETVEGANPPGGCWLC